MKIQRIRRRFRPFLERLEDRTVLTTWFVATSGNDLINNGMTAGTPFATINKALMSAATSGDTIMVAPGQYTEQLTISKSLTLTGAGQGTDPTVDTIIKAPDPLTPDASGKQVIVEMNNMAMVTMSGFTVEGPETSGGNSGIGIDYGIFVIGGATLDLSATTVTAIHGAVAQGNQFGNAIGVGNSATSQIGHATINNVIVTDYQKTGIRVDGAGTTATITNSTITGDGPITAIAQNGIQISRGAVAMVTGNNQISLNEFNGSPGQPSGPDIFNDINSDGILNYQAGAGTTIQGNNIFNNDIGIESSTQGPVSITGNMVLNNRFHGVLLEDGTNTAGGNTISGSVNGLIVVSFSSLTLSSRFSSLGVTPLAVTPNSVATVTGNTISNNSPRGVWVVDEVVDGVVPIATVSQNTIDMNGTGVVVGGGPNPPETENNQTVISQNSIFANSPGIGIDLQGDGVTLNQPGGTLPMKPVGTRPGPNNFLNFPILEHAAIRGTNLEIDGFAVPGSTIEFFVAQPDPTGFGQGKTYLVTETEGSASDLDNTTGTYGPAPINGLVQATATVTANRFKFLIPFSSMTMPVGAGDILTSTATLGEPFTSEFSGNIAVVNETADLSLTKTVDNPMPMFGTPITFTLTATNNGPVPATNVVVGDVLPAGLNFVSATVSQGTLASLPPGPILWQVGTLANGASADLKITVVTAAVGQLVNSAAVGTNDQFDPNLMNNLAQAPITVLQSPLQIGKGFFLASTILDPPPSPSGSVGSAAGPTVAPLNAALPFTDNFTATGDSPEMSPYWTDQRGTMIGANDQPMGVGDFNLSTLNGVSQANAAVTAGVSLGDGQTAGLVARYGGPGYSNFYLGQLRSIGNGQFQAAIFDNIGGTFNTLAVSSTISSGTGALEFEVVGSSLKLLLNNQLVAYAQDTSITAPGSVGMRLSQGANINSFSANKITAPTSQTTPFTDNFTNNGYGSQLTTNWSDQLGNVTVVNAAATGEGTFNLSTVNGLNIGNAKVIANVSVNPGGNVGLVARYGGPGYSNFYLGQLRDLGNGQFQAAIFKNIGGVFTTIAVGTTTAVTGTGTLEFEVVGSSLKLIFNNKLLAYGFDTSLSAAAGGSAGLRLGQGATASSFSADQIVVPTSQTLPFSDSFSNPGDGSQLSPSWSDQNGNIAVAGGAAVGAGDFNLSTVNGINTAEVMVAGDVDLTPGAGQSVGLVARYTGPLYNNFYLAQFRDIGNGQYQAAIFKNIGGAFSLVTLGAVTTKNAGRLQFKLKGSALEVDLDNTVLASVVDTSITGPGSVGMRLSMNAAMRNFSAS
jgi:uncharacterized repeat protein (TIGR01451 family)